MQEFIKKTAAELGADLCGIADISRFADAPEHFHPRDIYPDCKSVIVIAVAIPRSLALVSPRFIYCHFNHQSCITVDDISWRLARKIEDYSISCHGNTDFYRSRESQHDDGASNHPACAASTVAAPRHFAHAIPIPGDSPLEYWDPKKLEARGLISMKHAAVNAGLGTLGKNTLLLNKDYGNMLTIGAILTDLELPSDPLADSICLPTCHKCLDSCPVKALDGTSANQSLCRPNTYSKSSRGYLTVECNTCRTICPMRFGYR